ncbi:MAG: 16S rRNA (guanine(527)-N(7))-methyltransferase RsmG [Porticoccaceae bacterium]|jgi:16S rRNA (guanine527-N7)-methyltransferase|nr:16S rRNA (guanine(527)-N(7))-methyltransferase RsmG [Porticoccaceae bacterium]
MAQRQQLGAELSAGLKQQSIDLADQQIESLLEYLDLMNHWNRSINLTAVSDPLEQVRRHLLDSFSVYPYITASPVLDVGTGAGLPGIPLAIAQPDIEWHLLDNSTKRISFLRRVITTLNLQNVQLINSRVEDHKSDQPYSLIICRAFASLKEITHNAQHLMAADGSFLAMKGQYPEQEIADMSDSFTVTECYPLTVPGLSEDRHLLQIKKLTRETAAQ